MPNQVAVPSQDQLKKQGSKKSVLSIISNILFVLFLALVLLLAFNMRSNRDGMMGPSFGGFRAFEALTASMTPTIQPGGLILVQERDVANIQVGDIMTFRSQGTSEAIVTHRVVGIESVDGQLQFLTQGDANSSVDTNPVTTDRVVGVVVFWFNGYSSVATPQGMVVLLALLVAVFFIIPALLKKLVQTIKS